MGRVKPQSLPTWYGLSEVFLLPVLKQMLAGFPFVMLGIHADNGSEYINHKVAELLEKLRIEFTKSRPRHSNDNGLVETKNGAIVRKVFGGDIVKCCVRRFDQAAIF